MFYREGLSFCMRKGMNFIHLRKRLLKDLQPQDKSMNDDWAITMERNRC